MRSHCWVIVKGLLWTTLIVSLCPSTRSAQKECDQKPTAKDLGLDWLYQGDEESGWGAVDFAGGKVVGVQIGLD